MIGRKKSKIFYKLIILVIMAIFTCAVLCSGAIYLYLTPLLEKALVDNKRSMVIKMAEQVTDSLDEIALYAQNITFDETVQEALLKKETVEKGTFPYYSSILSLETKLKEYQLLRDSLIFDIFAVDEEGDVLETLYRFEEIMQGEPYKYAVQNDVSGNCLQPGEFNFRGGLGKRDTIAFVNAIYDKTNARERKGKIFILLDFDKIISPLVFDREEIQLELYDQNNQLIYSNLESKMKNQVSGSSHFTDSVGENRWTVNYQIAGKDITKTIQRMNLMVIGISAICLLTVLGVAAGLIQRMITPIETLIQGMKKVAKGSRNERIEIHTGDECEQAADVFNSMVASIESHTEQLLLSEKKQYHTQLKMLSYQLNPHFIYNTLNAVICLARKQSYQEIITLTRSFIMILQSLLRTDLQAMVTVEEERRYIDNYVDVLQICYENIPDIQWEIQEGLDETQIPRMILYPLVENSVFHGIIPSSTASMLRVTISAEEGWMRFTIEDDGIGCSESELNEIRNRLRREQTEGHIGLFNVNGRLNLIYEEVELLKIENREAGGTRICFGFKG